MHAEQQETVGAVLQVEELEDLEAPSWGFWAGVAVGAGIGVVLT